MQRFTALRGIAGVYVIARRDTGEGYIGSSANLGNRLPAHRAKLRRGVHPNARLQAVWTEQGEAAFVFLVLQRVDDVAALRPAEQRWLDGGTCEPGVGYNRAPTTHGVGWTYTDEQRARLSARLSGVPKTAQHRAALVIAQRGAVTADTRARGAKVGRSGRGVPKTAEHRARIGAAQAGSTNHRSKLTEAAVADIRRRLLDGERGRHLAAEYGVHEAIVSQIKSGRRWRHVPPAER